MSILRVKPQGDNRGKNKIYFCCHKDDFKGYFDLISDEILKYAGNSAIYYCENGDNEDFSEEHREDIKTMQLFVVPVTSRLVGSENAAMDKEIPFAAENGIPILPLLQENIIESYTKKFGTRQFLYKYDKDDTAIPYEEKLKNHLNSMLVDKETAERVKAAFDSYIFLSYRKRDRKFANDLMKLIHSSDELRDIAIWYDEFLIPGEYFPQTIEEALKKSKLFTMLVTPNLTDEKNYVISTEYPMAKRENKTILPAEAVKTDREKLKNCCRKSLEEDNFRAENINSDEIDNTVSAEDRELLFKNIAPLAKADNDRDPEHNYLIGLAYLRGIDVETNRERGAELIKASAEAGNTEAIKKLVSLYNTGEGVERNYDTAIYWQKKLVEILEDRLNKTNEFSDAEELIKETYNLGNFSRENGRAAEAIKTYYRAISLCDGTYINGIKFNLISYTIMINGNLSYVLIEERKLLKAQEIVEDTLKLLEGYKEGLFKKKRTSVCYDRLGDIYKYQDDFAKAFEYYMKAVELSERIIEISDTAESKRDLSVSYNKAGDLYSTNDNLSEARKYYIKALRISENIIEISDTIQNKRDLSICYERMGNVCKAQGDFILAFEYYTKSLQIRKRIKESYGTVEAVCDLAISYERIGNVYKDQGKLPEALEYYMKGLRMAENIIKTSDTVKAKEFLSIVCRRIAAVYKAQGDLNEAYEYYMKDLRIAESIIKTSDTIEAKRDLSISYNNIGDIYKAQENLSEALDYYMKGLRIREEIIKTSDTLGAKKNLSISYGRIGDVYKAQENLSEAYDYYMKALNLSEKIIKTSDTIEAKRDLSISYERIGDVYKAHKDSSEAYDYYRKALNLREEIIKTSDTLEAERDLSLSYVRIGDIYKEHKDSSEAYDYYRKALNLREKIIKTSDTIEAKRDLSINYERIGDIYKEQGNLHEAYDYYMKNLRIREEIIKTSDTAETKSDLSISYYKTGDILVKIKDFSGAEPYIIKCIELAEKHYDILSQSFFYQIMSDCYKNLGIIYAYTGRKEKIPELAGKIEASLNQGITDRKIKTGNRAFSYRITGNIYKADGDNENALKYYAKEIEIYEKLPLDYDNKKTLAEKTAELGKFLSEKENYKEAEKYFTKETILRKEICTFVKDKENYNALADAYKNWIRCLCLLGQYDEALKCFEAVCDYTENIGDSMLEAELYKTGAELYCKAGSYDEAEDYYIYAAEIFFTDDKTKKEAEACIREILIVSEKHHSFFRKRRTDKKLSELLNENNINTDEKQLKEMRKKLS